MYNPNYENGTEHSQSNEVETQSQPSLGVEVAKGRETVDLNTRADKMEGARSMVKYDYKSLLEEYKWLQSTVPHLALSTADKQALTKLATTQENPSAADLKQLAEITARFIENNPVLPASDSAWYKASLERLNAQQSIYNTLSEQTPEVRKENATAIRLAAIKELKIDLPSDKVAEIETAFPNEASKEAVAKLLELAQTRMTELNNSYNAEDKKTLRRIESSVSAIIKCNTEIEECNKVLIAPPEPKPTTPSTPLTPQQQRKQDELDYYDSRIKTNRESASIKLSSIVGMIAPEEFKAINSKTYVDHSDKNSDLLKVVQALVGSERYKSWRTTLPADEATQLSKFLEDKSAKLALTPEALKTLEKFATIAFPEQGDVGFARRNKLRTEVKELGLIAQQINKEELDKANWQRDFPDGTPVPVRPD